MALRLFVLCWLGFGLAKYLQKSQGALVLADKDVKKVGNLLSL